MRYKDAADIIAANIIDITEERDMSLKTFSERSGIGEKRILGILSGDMPNTAELCQISDALECDIADMVVDNHCTGDVIEEFKNTVRTDAARNALDDVGELADMIVFHAAVRENTERMMMPVTHTTLRNDEYVCGQEEHIHSDACSERILVCDNSDADHVHSDECCETILTCETPEHVHSDACLSVSEMDDEEETQEETDDNGISVIADDDDAENPDSGDDGEQPPDIPEGGEGDPDAGTTVPPDIPDTGDPDAGTTVPPDIPDGEEGSGDPDAGTTVPPDIPDVGEGSGDPDEGTTVPPDIPDGEEGSGDPDAGTAVPPDIPDAGTGDDPGSHDPSEDPGSHDPSEDPSDPGSHDPSEDPGSHDPSEEPEEPPEGEPGSDGPGGSDGGPGAEEHEGPGHDEGGDIEIPDEGEWEEGHFYHIDIRVDGNVRYVYIPTYVDVTVEKIWDDFDNEYADRPTSLYVYLIDKDDNPILDEDGNMYEVLLSDENDWSYTWYGLADGEYYVHEEDIVGYTLTEHTQWAEDYGTPEVYVYEGNMRVISIDAVYYENEYGEIIYLDTDLYAEQDSESDFYGQEFFYDPENEHGGRRLSDFLSTSEVWVELTYEFDYVDENGEERHVEHSMTAEYNASVSNCAYVDEETTMAGCDLVIDIDDIETEDRIETVSMTNSYVPITYAMPKTGSDGIVGFHIAGVSAICVSLVVLCTVGTKKNKFHDVFAAKR